jgi:heat shock protein HslJ/uncharacterized lipoprotein NlpE involved in copper resistance
MKQFVLIAGLVMLAACGSNDEPAADVIVDEAHNSRNSLDWSGIYTGVLPCADCEGIHTSVTLQADGSFSRRVTYLGKAGVPVTEEGAFAWDDGGGVVTLTVADGANPMYQVGEGRLFHLDMNGGRITGDLADRYILEKLVNDPRIEGVQWVLTELNGQPVQSPESGEQAYFELNASEMKITGHASCNRFFGTYEIKQGGRISFSENMGITMMACPDMSVEMAFMEALRRSDNYAVSADGLSLNRARMAPLARFRAAGR